MEQARIEQLNQKLKDVVAAYAKVMRLNFESQSPLTNSHRLVKQDSDTVDSCVPVFKALYVDFMQSLKNVLPEDVLVHYKDFFKPNDQEWAAPLDKSVRFIKTSLLLVVGGVANTSPDYKLPYWDEIVESNKLAKVYVDGVYTSMYAKSQLEFETIGLNLQQVIMQSDISKPEYWLWYDYLPTLHYTVKLLSELFQNNYDVSAMRCLSIIASGLHTSANTIAITEGKSPVALTCLDWVEQHLIRGARWNHITTTLHSMVNALKDKPTEWVPIYYPEFKI